MTWFLLVWVCTAASCVPIHPTSFETDADCRQAKLAYHDNGRSEEWFEARCEVLSDH
jgi:hypothetical protein